MKNLRSLFGFPLGFAMLTIGLTTNFLTPSSAKAEWYVAGMGGYSMPNDLTNTEFDFGPFEGTTFDLDLENSAMGGGKVGYYFPNWKYVGLGVETEGFFTWPNITQQEAKGMGGRCSTCTLFEPGAEWEVTTWGINAVARYPGKRLQPYVGAGLGIFFAKESFGRVSISKNWVPGLNVLAGVRGFVTPAIALFAEYKYNRATFNLGFLKGDYSTNMAVGGLSVHFDADTL